MQNISHMKCLHLIESQRESANSTFSSQGNCSEYLLCNICCFGVHGNKNMRIYILHGSLYTTLLVLYYNAFTFICTLLYALK